MVDTNTTQYFYRFREGMEFKFDEALQSYVYDYGFDVHKTCVPALKPSASARDLGPICSRITLLLSPYESALRCEVCRDPIFEDVPRRRPYPRVPRRQAQRSVLPNAVQDDSVSSTSQQVVRKRPKTIRV